MENTEILLKKIDEKLKEVLSEKRYYHSVGVMKKAEELAKKYGVDESMAKLVGLAHDIAKDMPKEEKLKYVKEHNISIDDIEAKNIELLHAKIGADICKNEYGFNEKMQNAIQYHTVGSVKMDDLAKILFIADKTEEGRKCSNAEQVKIISNESLEEQVIYFIDQSVKYTIEKGGLLHPDSIYTRNYLIEKRNSI